VVLALSASLAAAAAATAAAYRPSIDSGRSRESVGERGKGIVVVAEGDG
jgi:hypothetical protein